MRSIALLTTALLLLTGCACQRPTPQPPPSPVDQVTPAPQPTSPARLERITELVKQFCPVLYLNGEIKKGENFEPKPVEIIVDHADILDAQNPSFFEKATIANLLRWSQSMYYLDIEGLGLKTHSLDEYKAAYEKIKDSYPTTLYARVSEGTNGRYTVIQYWIFYYLNDWRNIHEGDWELVQLCFDGHTVEDLLNNEEQPLFAAYSQHQGGQRMSWSDMKEKRLVVENTHPVAYVARGSHANYFIPGYNWSGLDFDDTGLSNWKIIKPEELKLVVVPEPEVDERGFEWLKFKGCWGELLGSSVSIMDLRFWQDGPTGPPWDRGGGENQRWRRASEWASKLPLYPKPFWTSFLKLPGDWSKLAVFSVFSPAELHIYDSVGRHVGLDPKGRAEKLIPGATYIAPEGTDYKIIIISDADISQNYRIILKGSGTGTAEIRAQVPDATNALKRFLEYSSIPITKNSTARVDVKPELPLTRITRGEHVKDTATKLELDSDGDGTYDVESQPGDFADKHRSILKQTSPEKATPTSPENATPTSPGKTTPGSQ